MDDDVACGGLDTLAAWVAGALPDAERAAVVNHAASCEACHALIEGLIEGLTDREIDSAVDHLTDGAVDSANDRRTRGAIGSARSSRTTKLESGASPSDLWPELVRRGAQIGRYRIDATLGIGGMGAVYAAFDAGLDRRVAVKLLRPARGARSAGGHTTCARDRVLREARSLARLSHPNVVAVFDVGAHGDLPFVVMELVDGGNLGAWLARAPRTPGEIIECLTGIARGLAAVHAAGIVHRDVKPDNILVGLDGRARLTDFGLAWLGDAPLAPDPAEPGPHAPPDPARAHGARDPRAALAGRSRLTQAGMVLGTPAYMPPEQQAGRHSDARSDQWSFCATLYEALTGVRPFAIGDVAARSRAIAEGQLAAPARDRQLPRWLQHIVARGLRADPAARWPSMDAVVSELERGSQRDGVHRRLGSVPAEGRAA